MRTLEHTWSSWSMVSHQRESTEAHFSSRTHVSASPQHLAMWQWAKALNSACFTFKPWNACDCCISSVATESLVTFSTGLTSPLSDAKTITSSYWMGLILSDKWRSMPASDSSSNRGQLVPISEIKIVHRWLSERKFGLHDDHNRFTRQTEGLLPPVPQHKHLG